MPPIDEKGDAMPLLEPADRFACAEELPGQRAIWHDGFGKSQCLHEILAFCGE